METYAIALALLSDPIAAMAVETGPAEPETTATEPAEPEPAATLEPEPEPEPTPAPSAESAPAVSGSASTDPIDASDSSESEKRPLSPESPVQTGQNGDWAMQFTFGGLGTLSVAGIDDHGVNRLLITELGVRRIFKRVAIPFSIGAGVFNHNPDTGGTQNDAGLAGAVGVRVPFRIWRRIFPYTGGDLTFAYLDPTGDDNWLVRLGIGPVLGIEFYIAHRVSLLLQGQATIGVNIYDGLTQVSATTAISAGGQTGLLFYF